MASEKYYGTEGRKTSVARVYLVSGTGKTAISERGTEDYFGFGVLRMTVHQSLAVTETSEKFGACVNIVGGGMAGQMGVIRHGIPRTLLEVDQDYRSALKKAGFLTRNPRMKEGKKHGLKTARRAPQSSKW